MAAQAIIYGTLGFRASLEVTEHPRTKTLCTQLLPWLEELGLGARIEEFHREILASPHGGLPRESQTEAYWRGEGASFLGWAIQLFDKPDPTVSIDPKLLLSNLRILLPTAKEILSNARLRPQDEIDDYCAYCLTVRHQFQLLALRVDAQTSLHTLHQTRLAELGLSEAYSRLTGVEVEASTLFSTVPSVKGLYVVRAMTAEWLLGQDE
ncbi:MAG TPA: hypothetical protein VH592_25760 [Gemmataceae bacterium]